MAASLGLRMRRIFSFFFLIHGAEKSRRLGWEQMPGSGGQDGVLFSDCVRVGSTEERGLVPGFWFQHMLVGSLKGPQMTCCPAFLELRVSALPEATQLV